MLNLQQKQHITPNINTKGCKSCTICHKTRLPKTKLFLARFPLEPGRCRQWVKYAGIQDLAYLPIEKLHQIKYVCGLHFTRDQFNKNGNRLKFNAVPNRNLPHMPLAEDILEDFPLHIPNYNRRNEHSVETDYCRVYEPVPPGVLKDICNTKSNSDNRGNIDMAIPGVSTTTASGNMAIPGVNTTTASGNMAIPGVSTTTASGNMAIPGVSTTTASGNMAIPGVSTTTASGNMAIPGVSTTTASGNMAIPGVSTTTASGNMAIPGVSTTTASGNMAIPGVSTTTASGNMAIPGVSTTTANGEVVADDRAVDQPFLKGPSYSDVDDYMSPMQEVTPNEDDTSCTETAVLSNRYSPFKEVRLFDIIVNSEKVLASDNYVGKDTATQQQKGISQENNVLEENEEFQDVEFLDNEEFVENEEFLENEEFEESEEFLENEEFQKNDRNKSYWKVKLLYILHNNNYCGVCLNVDDDLNAISDEFEIVTNENFLRKTLGAVVEEVLGGNEKITNSKICNSCTEKLIQSYIFIYNAKEVSAMLDHYLGDLYNKTCYIRNNNLKDSNNEHSQIHNAVIALDNKRITKYFHNNKQAKGQNKFAHSRAKRKLKCLSCNVILPSHRAWRVHETTTHKNTHRCPICLQSFRTRQNFTAHYRTVQDGRLQQQSSYREQAMNLAGKATCEHCSYVCASKEALVEHVNSQHLDLQHSCDTCQQKFYSTSDLASHVCESKQARKCIYVCKYCDKQFICEKMYQRHKKSCELLRNRNQFQCDYCPSNFHSIVSLRLHGRLKHSN